VKSNWNDDPELTDSETADPIQEEIRLEVSRHHARMMLENEICEYSQWMPGDENNVADSLSRDDNVPDKLLAHLLRKNYPEQVPADLTIVQLPSEIVSWLTSLLQRLPVRTQSLEKHMRTKIGLGVAGADTSTLLESSKTISSTSSTTLNGSGSSEPSPQPSGMDDFLGHLMKPWLTAQSKIPSHLWCRPSETTNEKTPPETNQAKLADFYNSNSKPTRTRTLPKGSRKPCPAAF
jgi:hypothetical protein